MWKTEEMKIEEGNKWNKMNNESFFFLMRKEVRWKMLNEIGKMMKNEKGKTKIKTEKKEKWVKKKKKNEWRKRWKMKKWKYLKCREET